MSSETSPSSASVAALSSSISTFTSSTTSIAAITSTPTIPNASPTVTATVFSGNAKYSYSGCWSETTNINGTGGKRALDGGTTEALDSMSVSTCLAFCSVGSYAFAGLEYGRECWCAKYLSAFSTHLLDGDCNFACMGNSAEICGGSLKLTLYQASPSGASSRAAVSKNVPTRLFIVGLALLGMVIELS